MEELKEMYQLLTQKKYRKLSLENLIDFLNNNVCYNVYKTLPGGGAVEKAKRLKALWK